MQIPWHINHYWKKKKFEFVDKTERTYTSCHYEECCATNEKSIRDKKDKKPEKELKKDDKKDKKGKDKKGKDKKGH